MTSAEASIASGAIPTLRPWTGAAGDRRRRVRTVLAAVVRLRAPA